MYALDDLIADGAFVRGLHASLRGEAPAPMIRDAKIKLTTRCNLRCRMCSYWRREGEPTLPTSVWTRVIDDLAALGCRKVHFSGGEVLVRKDFLEIGAHAVGQGLRVNLTTNGTLVDKSMARCLVDMGIHSVSVSLDGPSAHTHDAIRGVPGAFRRTVKGIEQLVRFARGASHPPRIRVNVVMMTSNWRRLPELTDLAGRLGASDLHPLPVDEKGPRRKRLGRKAIETYNLEVAPRVLEIRRKYGFSTATEEVYPFGVTPADLDFARDGLYARGFYARRSCFAPFLHTLVAWDGAVYPCCMTTRRIEALGNVTQAPLEAIYHGEPYAQVRRDLAAGHAFPACHRCDLFNRENARLHAAVEAHSANENARQEGAGR